jgi:MFS family permease
VWQPPGVQKDPGQVTLRSLGPSVYLPSILFFIGDGSLIAIVALAARDLGASPALAGFVVALRGLGILAFDIPAGWALSRFGERATIAVASATVVLTLVGWTLTTSELLFAVLAFVQGCGWSAWQLARLAYVSEVVPPTLRGRAMSLLGGTNRVGLFLGPFLAALATHLGGFDGVYVMAIALTGAAAVVLFVTVPAGRDEHRKGAVVPVSAILRDHRRVFLTAGLAATALQALRQARNALLPLWADGIGLSVQTTAVLFGVSLGVELMFVYPGGSVMDRWGRKAVAIPCLVIMSIGLAIMPLTHGALTLALVAMLLGAGNGLSSGVVMTLGADFAPPATRVPFLGVWRVLSDLGTAGGPLAVAGATAAITLGGAAVAVGVVGLLAAGYVLRYVPETGVVAPRADRA